MHVKARNEIRRTSFSNQKSLPSRGVRMNGKVVPKSGSVFGPGISSIILWNSRSFQYFLMKGKRATSSVRIKMEIRITSIPTLISSNPTKRMSYEIYFLLTTLATVGVCFLWKLNWLFMSENRCTPSNRYQCVSCLQFWKSFVLTNLITLS